MNPAFILLQAEPVIKGTGDTGTGRGMIQVGLLVAMVLVMYLLIIRPQQKRQKEVRKMLEKIQKGDRVVTIGGIHGQVVEIRESIVVLCIDEQTQTKIEFAKSAISEVQRKPDPEVQIIKDTKSQKSRKE